MKELVLNAKGHAKNIGWRTDGDKAFMERLLYGGTRGQSFARRRECRFAPQVLHTPCCCRHTLRSLPEAAAVRIVTFRRRGSDFKNDYWLSVMQSRTTRPMGIPLPLLSRKLRVVMGMMRCWHIRGHLMSPAHVASVHAKHRSHSHLGPGRHDQQQHRRYCLLKHQTKSGRTKPATM